MIAIPSAIKDSLILLVEDNDVNQQIIRSMITKGGFARVEIAVDGKDALEKTLTLKPDIVVLDLLMPQMDGFDYCKEIRKDTNFSLMPILVQTGSDNRQDKLDILSYGADDFIHKPLDPDELILRLVIHLSRSHMMREMKRTCEYLSMELEHAQEVIRHLERTKQEQKLVAKLNRHYEVLETIAHLHQSFVRFCHV